MDARLNSEMARSHSRELRERATARRAGWPDDGVAPRPRRARRGSLHPFAVIGSLLTGG